MEQTNDGSSRMSTSDTSRLERFFKRRDYTIRHLLFDLEKIMKENTFDIDDWFNKTKEKVSYFEQSVSVLLLKLLCEKIGKLSINESAEYYFFGKMENGSKKYVPTILKAMLKAPNNPFIIKMTDFFSKVILDEGDEGVPFFQLLDKLERWRGEHFNQEDTRKSTEEIRKRFIKRLFLSLLLIETNKVQLSGANIQEQNSDVLFDTLAHNSKIKELYLKENAFGVKGMTYLALSLCFNNSIELIDLSRNHISAAHLVNLKEKLNDMNITNLLSLSLSENSIKGSEGGKAIGQLLENLPNLEHLNLNKNQLEKGGVYLFIKMTKLMKINCFSLKKLIISKTDLDEFSLKAFADVLKHPNCRLELLSLNDNNLNNHGGVSILKSLQLTNTMKELYLYNCNLNDKHFPLLKALIISDKIGLISLHKNELLNPRHFLELLSLSQVIKEEEVQEYFSQKSGDSFQITDQKITLMLNEVSDKASSKSEESQIDYQMQSFQFFDISDNKLTDFTKDDKEVLIKIIKDSGLEKIDILHSVDFLDENTKEESETFFKKYESIVNNKKIEVYF